MNIRFHMDQAVLNAQIAAYSRKLGIPLGEAIRTQARLLLEKVVKFTPPRKQAQVKPIEKIIQNTGQESLKKDLQAARRNRDTEWMQVLLRIRYDKRAVAHIFHPRLHKDKRQSRGRVKQDHSIYAIENSRGEYSKYMKSKLDNVGIFKSGWLPALRNVQGKKQGQWIEKHARPPGAFIDRTRQDLKPFYVIDHKLGGTDSQLVHFVRGAMALRIRSIPRHINAVLRERAKQVGLQAA
jgi:hypothetical protein